MLSTVPLWLFPSCDFITTEAALQVKQTLHTNYFGTKRMCQQFLPLIKPNGRLVNVSSMAGKLGSLKNEDLKQEFLNRDITVDQVDSLMERFQVGLLGELLRMSLRL